MNNDSLKIRIMEARARIKAIVPKGYTDMFMEQFPEHKRTRKKRNRLHNVIHTKIADEKITIQLEQFASHLETKNA